MQLKAYHSTLPRTSPEDPRIGHLMGENLSEKDNPRCILIGFPSDEGVRRNGGRAGAAEAPDSIRKALYKMTPDAENHDKFIDLIKNTPDKGNLAITGDVEADQESFGEVIGNYLKKDIIPIILGGGHETAFAHFTGYVKANLKTSILNIDAHTDVRPLKDGKAHSGSPFRQAIEHKSKCCEKYLVAGLQPHSAARAHLDFIEQHNGSYLFRDETTITSITDILHKHNSERLMVTFDMDAVDQAYAPGVSAPCTNGLQPDLWLTAACLAGRNKQVTSFDLSEVNPEYDRDTQTVKLAALTVWHFLLGLSQRIADSQ